MEIKQFSSKVLEEEGESEKNEAVVTWEECIGAVEIEYGIFDNSVPRPCIIKLIHQKAAAEFKKLAKKD